MFKVGSSSLERASHGIDYSPEAHSLIPKTTLRHLYPPIEPRKSGHLSVDDVHSIYWEVCGNLHGSPVLYLHGGPGSGCIRDHRRFFDPAHYCIYLFDQRGSGRSTPAAELENNTTWDLVEDIERLRNHFRVSRWHLFGGSWGSTLSLAYSQKHPDRVISMIMWGIFTLRKSEVIFTCQKGTEHIFPEFYEPYVNYIPPEERDDLIAAYYKRLIGKDEAIALGAAQRWARWEMSTVRLYAPRPLDRPSDEKWTLGVAKIEAHYCYHGGFMREGQLLEKQNIDKIRHIPAIICNGRYDVVCPPTTAFELWKAWPEAELHIVPDSGHSPRDPGLLSKLIESSDKMRSIV